MRRGVMARFIMFAGCGSGRDHLPDFRTSWSRCRHGGAVFCRLKRSIWDWTCKVALIWSWKYKLTKRLSIILNGSGMIWLACFENAVSLEFRSSVCKERSCRLKRRQRVSSGVRGVLKGDFPNLTVVNTTNRRRGQQISSVTLSKEEMRALRDFAVDQSLETIRNRIDQFGVSEPIIQRQGQQDILIQLPGIQDPDRAKEIIGKTALLSLN